MSCFLWTPCMTILKVKSQQYNVHASLITLFGMNTRLCTWTIPVFKLIDPAAKNRKLENFDRPAHASKYIVVWTKCKFLHLSTHTPVITPRDSSVTGHPQILGSILYLAHTGDEGTVGVGWGVDKTNANMASYCHLGWKFLLRI